MKKILIINPFGIGDVLFTTPLISAIKEGFPDASICYWCNKRVEEVFLSNPKVSRVFALSRGDLKKIYNESPFEGVRQFFSLLSQIKKWKFDIAFDFSLDHRYGIISWLLGIKNRVGFDYKKRGWFLTDKIIINGYKGSHVAARYLELSRFLGNAPESNRYQLEVFASEIDKIRARISLEQAGIKEQDILVAIAPGAGASWGESASLKHWQAMKYARLADSIIDKFNVKVLILGDISEKQISDVVVTAMKHKPIDLAGKTTLGELIAVIGNARLLITNDGGPLHIAAALGVKTVSIFGPVDDSVYGPYPASDKHIVVKHDLGCGPCYQNFKMDICNNNRECINSISAEEVFAAVEKQLE